MNKRETSLDLVGVKYLNAQWGSRGPDTSTLVRTEGDCCVHFRVIFRQQYSCTLKLGKNAQHIAFDIFKCIFVKGEL